MDEITLATVGLNIVFFGASAASLILAIAGAFSFGDAWFAFQAKNGHYRKYIHDTYYNEMIGKASALGAMYWVGGAVCVGLALQIREFL